VALWRGAVHGRAAVIKLANLAQAPAQKQALAHEVHAVFLA